MIDWLITCDRVPLLLLNIIWIFMDMVFKTILKKSRTIPLVVSSLTIVVEIDILDKLLLSIDMVRCITSISTYRPDKILIWHFCLWKKLQICLWFPASITSQLHLLPSIQHLGLTINVIVAGVIILILVLCEEKNSC